MRHLETQQQPCCCRCSLHAPRGETSNDRRLLACTGTGMGLGMEMGMGMGGGLMWAWTLPPAFRRAALKRWKRPITVTRLAQQALARSAAGGKNAMRSLPLSINRPSPVSPNCWVRVQWAGGNVRDTLDGGLGRERDVPLPLPHARGGRAQRRQQGRRELSSAFLVVLTAIPIEGITIEEVWKELVMALVPAME